MGNVPTFAMSPLPATFSCHCRCRAQLCHSLDTLSLPSQAQSSGSEVWREEEEYPNSLLGR